jgi:hypothetical protein
MGHFEEVGVELVDVAQDVDGVVAHELQQLAVGRFVVRVGDEVATGDLQHGLGGHVQHLPPTSDPKS